VDEKLKQNISERSTWLRGLYMLLFGVIYSVAELVAVAVAVFQFLSKLITGRLNTRLLKFGQSICVFIYQVWQFLTFNREALPFPFGPWPSGDPDDRLDPPRKPGG
jgi:hypothetical protein